MSKTIIFGRTKIRQTLFTTKKINGFLSTESKNVSFYFKKQVPVSGHLQLLEHIKPIYINQGLYLSAHSFRI